MSLDTEKLHRLTGKGFDKLYNKDPAMYKEMAQKALEYAKTCVPPGEKVRMGDVVAVIQNAVRILPSFEAHLSEKKLTQRYWQLWFAEYILEQVFPQPDLTPKASN
jgi:hypothetical protein